MRRILSAANLIACLGVAFFAAEIKAQSPAPLLEAPDSDVQTIDVASLSSVLDLDGPWRLHAGDDQHFADPLLDDSAWPSVRPNQTFQAVGIPSLPGGFLWARARLRNSKPGLRLAIRIRTGNDLPFELYANGNRIYSSPSMQARARQSILPAAIPLPGTPEIALAVRIFNPGSSTLQSLPVSRVQVGSLQAIVEASDFEQQKQFDNKILARALIVLLYLTLFPFALTLFFAQRNHLEYLWLGLFNLFSVLYNASLLALTYGGISQSLIHILLVEYNGFVGMIAAIEFIARFALVQRFLPVRLLQAYFLLCPLVSIFSGPLYVVAILIGTVAYLILSTFYLTRSWRRGQTECGLLILPAAANTLITLWYFAADFWPRVVHFPAPFHVGRIGFAIDDFTNLLVILGFVGIVLYRFINVSKQEQRSAAELEAARAIQRVLIPAQPESAPVISIDAVFLPASEVGGDFYRCRVLPDGSQWVQIGDVSGKGTAAGITGAMLLGAAEGHESDPPAQHLSRLNQALCRSGIGGFVTCLVLHISPDGVVTAANAGHLAPYRNGEEVELDSGFPLGITSEAAYSETRFELDDSDRLTLLSDGVVEARNQSGELFGFSRTRDISGLSAEKIASAAQGFGQNDDITVLTLSYVRLTTTSLREGHRLAKIR